MSPLLKFSAFPARKRCAAIGSSQVAEPNPPNQLFRIMFGSGRSGYFSNLTAPVAALVVKCTDAAGVARQLR
jgi:hypothetical protein